MPLVRSADRLQRILVLVPWVMANPGCSVDDVCARFGMTRAQLTADLELLFMCGLPPFGPGDLIEAYIQEDEVVIRFADYLARPPRLTRAEALGLLVTGRALLTVPGLEEADSLRRALEKLANAVSPNEAERAEDIAARIAVDFSGAGSDLLGEIRRAIDERRRVRIAYYSAGRDAMSERQIDPLVAFSERGNWYVGAYDHATNEDRVFRIDRIRELSPGDGTFEPRPIPDTTALFTPSPRDIEVVIEIGPQAAWIAEVVPFEGSEDLGGGRARLTVRTPHLAWLVRLLLSAGAGARAVEPPELVAQVRAAAERALANY